MRKTKNKLEEDTLVPMHNIIATAFAKLSTFIINSGGVISQAYPDAWHFRAPIIICRECNSENNSINFDTATETEYKTIFSFSIQHSKLISVECGKRVAMRIY